MKQPPRTLTLRIFELEDAFDYHTRDHHGFDDESSDFFLDLTTCKPIPKDVDLLVEVDDSMSLDKLARLKRRLLGKTMQTGDRCGADVFICNPRGKYLGRICSWKRCAPGIRQSCQAQHCGRREYLSDDLQNVCLDSSTVAEPPVELWPELAARIELPGDVTKELIDPLIS